MSLDEWLKRRETSPEVLARKAHAKDMLSRYYLRKATQSPSTNAPAPKPL